MITTTTTAGHLQIHHGANTFSMNPNDEHTKPLFEAMQTEEGRAQLNALADQHGLSNGIRVFLGKELWLPEKEE
jgi:hypothetical protein